MTPSATAGLHRRPVPRTADTRLSRAIPALVLAAVLLPDVACAAGAKATRIDFVAIDRGSPDRAPRADPDRACRVGFQAGTIRSSVQTLDRPAGEGVPLLPMPGVGLGDATDAALQFDCPVDAGWRLGLAWREGRARASGSFADRGFSVQANFSGPEAVLSRRLLRSTTGIDLHAVLAVGTYRSNYRETFDDWRLRSSDRALGARLGLEASWGLSESVEVFARAEHVWLDFGRASGVGDPTGAASDAGRARLDFSGPAIGAGVRWRLR